MAQDSSLGYVYETSGQGSPLKPAQNSTMLEGSQLGRRQPKLLNSSTANASQSALYIIVFGYPPDKYSVTVEYFKSLGESTDADPNTEVANCFKIGYKDPADAMRAVRKNGEVLGGSWMIGAKWAVSAFLARTRIGG
jgi:nuclear pore complex protein Nup53